MAANVFHHLHRVTYAECTVGNHVYYGRYLEYLEEARGEFFRALGTPLISLQQSDTIFPAIECRLLFKSAARYDDVLKIGVELETMGGVRLGFRYRITNQSAKVILEAQTMHVCTTLHEKPKRIPLALKATFDPYLNPVLP